MENNEIEKLRREVADLKSLILKDNFSDLVVQRKIYQFNERARFKNYNANPTFGAIGDVIVVLGKLKVCTTASSTSPTWTIVGTQT